MGLKYIVAVERKNLTEQDVFRLLGMDGTEYTNEQLFKWHLQDSIAEWWKVLIKFMTSLETN